MDEKKKKLMDLSEEVSFFKEINISDIPCVDLYMDQITTFFEDKLGHLKRDESDAIFTKTMINNYTKDKVLMRTKSKKYSKEHIMLLILIYNLKQVLSINDIKTLFSPIIKNLASSNEDNISLDEIYTSFLEIKEGELKSFSNNFEERLKVISEKTSTMENNTNNLAELFLTVLMLVNQANEQKRLAEKIIDNFFKDMT